MGVIMMWTNIARTSTDVAVYVALLLSRPPRHRFGSNSKNEYNRMVTVMASLYAVDANAAVIGIPSTARSAIQVLLSTNVQHNEWKEKGIYRGKWGDLQVRHYQYKPFRSSRTLKLQFWQPLVWDFGLRHLTRRIQIIQSWKSVRYL